jgi:hypothetical protein
LYASILVRIRFFVDKKIIGFLSEIESVLTVSGSGKIVLD